MSSLPNPKSSGQVGSAYELKNQQVNRFTTVNRPIQATTIEVLEAGRLAKAPLYASVAGIERVLCTSDWTAFY